MVGLFYRVWGSQILFCAVDKIHKLTIWDSALYVGIVTGVFDGNTALRTSFSLAIHMHATFDISIQEM
jgi:hypothetical protein